MDAEPDDQTPAPRGQTGRSTPARGVRKPAAKTARKPAASPRTPAAAKPAAAKPTTAKATAEPGAGTGKPAAPRASRSTARAGTVGRPAYASAPAAAAAEIEPEPIATAAAEGAETAPAPEPGASATEIIAIDVVEPETATEPEAEVAAVVDVEPASAPEPEPIAVPQPDPEVVAARPLAPLGDPADGTALAVRGLTKRYGATVAVDAIDLDVPSGCFYGFVGPNGAGKTTTLSMVTGLLRPDAGTAVVNGADIWADPATAKRSLGVLPDRLRLFDRLTGAEYLQHAGALHGLDRATVARRSADLIQAFGLESAARRFVSDFSAGMVKKLAIAAAMIHSPRLLVLDEPFESVDPVSAQLVIEVLKKFSAAGGTVLLSSHSMDLVQRVCDYVAVIADGRLLAAGPMAEVLDGASLEDRFVELAGGATAVEGMEWLQSFSD